MRAPWWCCGALALAAGCDDPVDLRHPVDAAVRDVADDDPRDDPYARMEVQTLPADEAQEALCNGVDDDGDGRVDEGWVYEVAECSTVCTPDAYVARSGGAPYFRPMVTLGAVFDGAQGAVIWREGYIQQDCGVVYEEVLWEGGRLEHERRGFLQWRAPLGRSLAQPTRLGSLARVDGATVALWGFSPAACALRRVSRPSAQCVANLSALGDSRRGLSDGDGVHQLESDAPRGSGLVADGARAWVATVRARGGIALHEVLADGTIAFVGASDIPLNQEQIGQLRGARWNDDELVWIYEFLAERGTTSIRAFWTDRTGQVTRAPVEVAPEGMLDASTMEQLFVAGDVLMATVLIAGRGYFLARYDRATGERALALLDRTMRGHRASWDGETLFVCAEQWLSPDFARVRVTRYSARGERLGDSTTIDGRWPDCAIAASHGRAIVGLALYGRSTGQALGDLVGIRCPGGL